MLEAKYWWNEFLAGLLLNLFNALGQAYLGHVSMHEQANHCWHITCKYSSASAWNNRDGVKSKEASLNILLPNKLALKKASKS